MGQVKLFKMWKNSLTPIDLTPINLHRAVNEAEDIKQEIQ